MIRFRIGLLLLALVCCLVTGCGGDTPTPPPAGETPPAQEVQPPEADKLPPKG